MKTVSIGSRWEPLVDKFIIERLDGATHRLHHPVRREVVMETSGPCECSTSGFHNLFLDGDRVRLYYHGLPGPIGEDGKEDKSKRIICYAESADGIHFTRPSLGLVEVSGSKDNNVIWRGSGNFCVFRDDKPGIDPAERYKAVGSEAGAQLLWGYCSPDGIHWRFLQDEPLAISSALPDSFDSLNICFWDALKERYRVFSRYWNEGNLVRAIHSCESEDFVHWTEPALHQYSEGVPAEQLYTNATIPCPGAEHILLSFPMRLVYEGPYSSEGMDYPAVGASDAVFMSSRDGVHWDRSFVEAWLRPGLDRRNWTHRSNIPAQGIIPTGPDEWSMYVGEHYGWSTNRLRRVTLRPLGFASVHAGYAGGEVLTKPLTFPGSRLYLNFSTSVVGEVKVIICDPDGNPLKGFDDMVRLFGDELDAPVPYDLSPISGKPVRIRLLLKDADVFALRIGN